MNRISLVLRVSAAVLACGLLQTPGAQGADALPEYTPHPVPAAVIRVYGSDLNGLVGRWEKDFRAFTPGCGFRAGFRAATAGRRAWRPTMQISAPVAASRC